MEVTKEQAKSDLEKMMMNVNTVGDGTAVDRAAQLVIQTMEVLESRLPKRDTIKALYFEMYDSSKSLPPLVYQVAKDYADNNISEKDAGERLQKIKEQYKEVFHEMGISPEISKVLFGTY